MVEKYTKTYRIDDIPNYHFLFVRDGSFVFVTDKHTGEISDKLTLGEYCDMWRSEYSNNYNWIDYFIKEYFTPKSHPDTAIGTKELLQLCSDKTRHRKGDDGFLLDFLWGEHCTLTETKLFKYLCDNVVVWNYSVVDPSVVHTVLRLKSKKHAGRVFKSLEERGLIKLLHERFDSGTSWKSLVKVHPKLFWKGRYSAWAVAIGESYEYVEAVGIE